jgi:hypothetical protein
MKFYANYPVEFEADENATHKELEQKLTEALQKVTFKEVTELDLEIVSDN